jgi:hypothetical protein
MDAWVDKLLEDKPGWVPKTMGDPIDPDSVRSADGCDLVFQHSLPGPYAGEVPHMFERNPIACVGEPEVLLYKAGSKLPEHADRRRDHPDNPKLLHIGTLLFVRYTKDAKGGQLIEGHYGTKKGLIEWTCPEIGPGWQQATIYRGDVHRVTTLEAGERVVVKMPVYIDPGVAGRSLRTFSKAADIARADHKYDARVASGVSIEEALGLWHTEYTGIRTKRDLVTKKRFD